MRRPRTAAAGLLFPLVLAVGLAGCTSYGSGNRPRVVATTTQVADLARQVGGDRVQVVQILRPNSDPHEYEPRPSDARALEGAKLVLRSGGDVDGWLGGLIAQAGAGTKVVTLSDAVGRIDDDPHWWQDPRNAERAVVRIRDALGEADPKHRAELSANAASYLARLRRLDAAISACIRRVPPAQRRLVTSHDAFAYYTRRYGIDLVGAVIPSLSSQAQPSARQTQRLVDQVRAQHVSTIFPESSLNPKLEGAIAREAGAHVGRPLWADSLGAKGSSGATYVDSLAANTEALVAGFTGGRVHCRPPT